MSSVSGRAQNARNEQIRAVVRKLVEEQGGQVAAARALGVTQGALSQFVLGKTGAGQKLIEGLESLLGRPIAELVQPGESVELDDASSVGAEAIETAGHPDELRMDRYEGRYPNREAAIRYLVSTGLDEETVRLAARAAGIALRSDEDPHVIAWSDRIRAALRVLKSASTLRPEAFYGVEVDESELDAKPRRR